MDEKESTVLVEIVAEFPIFMSIKSQRANRIGDTLRSSDKVTDSYRLVDTGSPIQKNSMLDIPEPILANFSICITWKLSVMETFFDITKNQNNLKTPKRLISNIVILIYLN